MARTLAVLKGATPAAGAREIPGLDRSERERTARRRRARRGRARRATASAQPVGGSTAGTTYYSPSRRRLRSGRHAAQLPARQLSDADDPTTATPAPCCSRTGSARARALAPAISLAGEPARRVPRRPPRPQLTTADARGAEAAARADEHEPRPERRPRREAAGSAGRRRRSRPSTRRARARAAAAGQVAPRCQEAETGGEAGAARSDQPPGSALRAEAQRAPSPSTLTPSLPLALQSSIAGVPSFFIESFHIPPFLLPIFQAAGTAYGIPWQVLAAINEVETDYGRDLSVSSAGAEGWMQFLPAEWAQYGVDANGDGFKDPYNPADAIFAAARYLRAAGGDTNIKAAVYSYNHSQAYVDIGDAARAAARRHAVGTARRDHRPDRGALPRARRRRTSATASRRSPAGARGVGQDARRHDDLLAGRRAGDRRPGRRNRPDRPLALARAVRLAARRARQHLRLRAARRRRLGVSGARAARATRGQRTGSAPGAGASAETAPERPGDRRRAAALAAVARAPAISGLALGAAAALESAAEPPATRPARAPRGRRRQGRPRQVRVFSEGANEVYLHPLRRGVQVIAGTVLGHLGTASRGTSARRRRRAPHALPDPSRRRRRAADRSRSRSSTAGWRSKTPRSSGPRARTRSSRPRRRSARCCSSQSSSCEPQVLHDRGIHLGAAGARTYRGAGSTSACWRCSSTCRSPA